MLKKVIKMLTDPAQQLHFIKLKWLLKLTSGLIDNVSEFLELKIPHHLLHEVKNIKQQKKSIMEY